MLITLAPLKEVNLLIGAKFANVWFEFTIWTVNNEVRASEVIWKAEALDSPGVIPVIVKLDIKPKLKYLFNKVIKGLSNLVEGLVLVILVNGFLKLVE